jgi:putative transposase
MEVKRIQAYKFKLMPNGVNQRGLPQYAGSGRFVFNKALALSQRYYRRFKKSISYQKMCGQLPKWKRLHPFLAKAPSQVLQQPLKDLDKAYVNFFKGNSDFPRFKKKSKGSSFRYPQGCELDQSNARIKLPKLGWVRY